MFLLFILVSITLEKYIQVKDLSITEESPNHTSFLFKLENTLMNGYFIFDTNDFDNHKISIVNVVIKDGVTNSHILQINEVEKKKINGIQKNVIALNSNLYSQNWYKLEVTPSYLIIQQGNILQFDVAIQNQKNYIIQDCFIGLTNFYIKNSRQQNQINVQALNFTKINKHGIDAQNALKLYISLPDNFSQQNNQLQIKLNSNNTIFENNKQDIFDFFWSDLTVYDCTYQEPQIHFFISDQLRQNFEIIIDFQVGSWLQNSINFILDSINQEKQVHIFQLQDIKQYKMSHTRLLQFQDDENINPENMESTISEYINQIFGLNSSMCKSLAQTNSLYQNVSLLIQNTTSYVNTLNINQTLLQNQTNSTNSLNYQNQLSFSLDKQISVNLNLSEISSGQIMWYEISPKNDSFLTIQNQIQNYSSNLIDSFQNISQVVVWNGSFIFQNKSGLYQTSTLINNNTIIDYRQQINPFDQCISLSVSVAGNYSNILTSICLKNMKYWITSYILPQTNYSKMIKNITQMFYKQLQFQKCYNNCNNSSIDVKFLDIKKTYQIQNYVFILGQINDTNKTYPLYQIHVLDFSNNNIYELQRISCYDSTKNNETIIDKNITENDFNYSNVTDFNVTILYNISLEFNSTYSARGIVFFICSKPNQLRYYSFNFVNTTNLTFNKNSQGFKYLNCLLFNNTFVILQQIFVYMVQQDQIIMALTTKSNYSAVFIVSYNPIRERDDALQFEKTIAMIPPYLNWTQSPQGVLNSKHLLLIYQNPIIDQYALAVYDMIEIILKSANNVQDDFAQVINFMQAGTQAINNNTLLQIQMLEFSSESAILLECDSLILQLIDNSNAKSTKISTFKYIENVKILVNLSHKSYNQHNYLYNLIGYNQYNQTTANLYFFPPKTPTNYSIIIVCIVFTICLGLGIAMIIYFFKYLNKLYNKKNSSYFQEIELKE